MSSEALAVSFTLYNSTRLVTRIPVSNIDGNASDLAELGRGFIGHQRVSRHVSVRSSREPVSFSSTCPAMSIPDMLNLS